MRHRPEASDHPYRCLLNQAFHPLHLSREHRDTPLCLPVTLIHNPRNEECADPEDNADSDTGCCTRALETDPEEGDKERQDSGRESIVSPECGT